MTRRPLPLDDRHARAEIAALPDREREAIARVWRERIDGELRAIPGFALLGVALRGLGADRSLCALADRARSDEERHAELCRQVASIYLGHDLAMPAAPARPFVTPTFAGASPSLHAALQVVAMSCLAETTSSAFIEASLEGTRGRIARAALRDLLTDEIDHARLGWAFLASPRAAPLRAGVQAWIPSLVRAHFATWRRPEPELAPPPPSLARHGCPGRAVSDAAVLCAARDLLHPGFARLGIAAPTLLGQEGVGGSQR